MTNDNIFELKHEYSDQLAINSFKKIINFSGQDVLPSSYSKNQHL